MKAASNAANVFQEARISIAAEDGTGTTFDILDVVKTAGSLA